MYTWYVNDVSNNIYQCFSEFSTVLQMMSAPRFGFLRRFEHALSTWVSGGSSWVVLARVLPTTVITLSLTTFYEQRLQKVSSLSCCWTALLPHFSIWGLKMVPLLLFTLVVLTWVRLLIALIGEQSLCILYYVKYIYILNLEGKQSSSVKYLRKFS